MPVSRGGPRRSAASIRQLCIRAKERPVKTFVGFACCVALIATPLHAKERDLAFKPITGGFFALSVANLPESVEWYSQKLGLSVVFEAQGPVAVTTLEGGGLLVELVRNPAARPRT